MPNLTIFAGPNGAGKSSIVRRVDFRGRNHLLEADAIAARIHSGDPGMAAIRAGREVLRRTQEYLDSDKDFAIETTLSGNWTTRLIIDARARRFFVRVIYVYLDNPERNVQRVQERAAQGGHNVPDGDVRRRYARSFSNLKKIANLVDELVIYDNSGPEPQRILAIRSGAIASGESDLPSWARDLVRAP